MITAMQMMLNDLISKRETYENASMYHSVTTLETSIELAEYLLEKEKEQIIKSHIDGFDHIVAEFKKQEYAEEYFNKTYKNQTP
jgi:hypothetical protein